MQTPLPVSRSIHGPSIATAHPTPDAGRRGRAAILHLGSRGCRPEPLLAFLKGLARETLYVVGDFIDCRRMRGRVDFPDARRAVVLQVYATARAGMRVIYASGNHDVVIRTHEDATVAGVEIALEATASPPGASALG